jgi:hypothetical protein
MTSAGLEQTDAGDAGLLEGEPPSLPRPVASMARRVFGVRQGEQHVVACPVDQGQQRRSICAPAWGILGAP